jgi:hypothetical protein
MIYLVIFILMAICGWISYEMHNAPFEDKDKKTPK